MALLLGPGISANEFTHSNSRRIAEIMTRDPVTVASDASLSDVVMLMEKHRVKRLPVMEKDRVVGIVSRSNLLRALGSLVTDKTASDASDSEIHDQILKGLAATNWAAVGCMDVIVHDGTADVWGTILDERQRAAVLTLVENTPGVKLVRDHVTWVDTMSGMSFSPDEATARAALGPQ